jgi:site-specific recombinase XerD
MLIEDKKRYLALVEQKKRNLPWYVSEFLEHKDAENCSPSTLDSYCRDFECFFDWIIAECFFVGQRRDVPIEILEQLRIQNITTFRNHCKNQLDNGLDTIARKVASLKSLFYYLANVAEDEDFYPYLKRNVMAKVKAPKEKISPSKRAENISGKILTGEEFNDFRLFVAEGYGFTISSQRRKYEAYLHNRERDLAIVSLILGSGLRISEALSINLEDIDWKLHTISINRKGNIEDIVPFSSLAAQDIQAYLDLREIRYKVNKSEQALFLSSPTGKGGKSQRLTIRAFQKRFEDFATAYGKNTLTVHKLRHSFATEHFKKNNNLPLLKEVLNHSDINTTMIYTHLTNEERRNSVNNTDK